MSESATRALLDGFERWLLHEGYAASTAAQTRIDAARIIEDCLSKRRPPARLRFVGLRLQRFLAALELEGGLLLGPSDLGEHFVWLCGPEAKDAHQQEHRRGRKLVARSIDDQNWLALYRAIHARPGLPARVIEAQMVSGLRVGDVLRIETKALRDAIKHNVLLLQTKGGRVRELHLQGPMRAAFERLWAALEEQKDVDDITEALAGEARAKGYRTAYKQVQRELHHAADALELPGRAHTHRLRRTVAMQALRTTRDIRLVQQLLGHLSPASTMRYVDEERPGEVADIAGALHERFLGRE